MAIEITVGDLIDELKEYPEDTPIWPQIKLSNGFLMMLDFKFSSLTSLDGVSRELHLVFKKSEIYDLKNGDGERQNIYQKYVKLAYTFKWTSSVV